MHVTVAKDSEVQFIKPRTRATVDWKGLGIPDLAAGLEKGQTAVIENVIEPFDTLDQEAAKEAKRVLTQMKASLERFLLSKHCLYDDGAHVGDDVQVGYVGQTSLAIRKR